MFEYKYYLTLNTDKDAR